MLLTRKNKTENYICICFCVCVNVLFCILISNNYTQIPAWTNRVVFSINHRLNILKHWRYVLPPTVVAPPPFPIADGTVTIAAATAAAVAVSLIVAIGHKFVV